MPKDSGRWVGEKWNRDGGKKREQINSSQTRNAEEMRDAEEERKQKTQRCMDSTNPYH